MASPLLITELLSACGGYDERLGASRFLSGRVITGTRWLLNSCGLPPPGSQRDRNHGQDEFAVRCLRSRLEEVADLGQPAGSLGLVHYQEI
jgi:hypothetical protein